MMRVAIVAGARTTPQRQPRQLQRPVGRRPQRRRSAATKRVAEGLGPDKRRLPVAGVADRPHVVTGRAAWPASVRTPVRATDLQARRQRITANRNVPEAQVHPPGVARRIGTGPERGGQPAVKAAPVAPSCIRQREPPRLRLAGKGSGGKFLIEHPERGHRQHPNGRRVGRHRRRRRPDGGLRGRTRRDEGACGSKEKVAHTGGTFRAPRRAQRRRLTP